MRKTFTVIFTVIAVVAIAFGGALIYGRHSFMSELNIDHPEIALGPLPLSLVEIGIIGPDMPYRIDMGSPINTINRDYLEKLKERGFDVDSSATLMYARTALGDERLITKRYRVSLPVYAYDIDVVEGKVVSRLDTTNLINMLHNVDFVMTQDADEVPRFGRPFFNHFFVEYDHDIRSLRFHTDMPDGYEEIKGTSREFALFSDPAMYLTLKVDGEEHDFFINSSMPRAGILMPADRAPEVDDKNVYADFIPSMYGKVPAIINYNVWVEWNDRAGTNVCYFGNYGVHPYALNPFNFLTQDAVFSFGDSRIFLRPYAPRQRRNRTNDAFAR